MIISVNGVAVEAVTWGSAELAAARELLRQRAVARGLLPPQAVGHEEISAAIERLLAEEVRVPSPNEEECRRHYENHKKDFCAGELACVRHILFQVTASVPIAQIRAQAEGALAEVLTNPDRFAALARELSNCPSGQQGGNLGQIGRGDTVPEFERAVFAPGAMGLLRELVKTRYGFHVVAIDQHIPGKMLPFEAVRERIAELLKTRVEERALRQYVSILAGQAEVVGADLRGADTPLVQ